MEVSCLVLSILAVGVAIGSVSFSLLRKPSCRCSVESLEAFKDEQRAFKRQMIDEWENAHHKLRSIAGRIDRSKRTEKGEQREEETQIIDAGPQDLAGLNRAILRGRGVNLPGV